MSFITHRASRQSDRGHQSRHVQGGSLAPKPFLQGDQKYAEQGPSKKVRLAPASVGSSTANGLVIHGRTQLGTEEATDLDEEDVKFNINYNGLGRLRFANPIEIPTVVGPVNVLGKVYSDGLELGAAATPDVVGMTIAPNPDGPQVSHIATVGTVIGTLTAIGGTAPVVFSILADTDDKFQIGGASMDELQVKNTFNLDTTSSHDVTIRATDINSKTFDRTYTVSVTYTSVNAVTLNGTDEYLRNNSVSGTAVDITSGELTLSYWINQGVDVCNHFALGDTPTGNIWKVLTYSPAANTFRALVGETGTSPRKNYEYTFAFDDGAWHHICVTYTMNSLKVYFDGSEETPTSLIVNDTMTGPLNASNILHIGQRRQDPSTTLNGRIDNISFFSTEFSAAEVTEIYNAGSPNFNPNGHTQSASLLGWWAMESLVGGVVQDWHTGGTIDLSTVNIDATNFSAV